MTKGLVSLVGISELEIVTSFYLYQNNIFMNDCELRNE